MRKVVAISCLLLVACATARPPELVPAAVLAPVVEMRPPSAVEPTTPPPAPPPPRRYYAGPMIALDLLILISFVPVMGMIDEQTRDSDRTATATAALYLGGYLFGGPIIHNAYGNDRQRGNSFLRRLGYPVLFGFGGALVGAVAEDDCNGELCGLAPILFGIVGAGVGVVVAAIHDWTKAYRF